MRAAALGLAAAALLRGARPPPGTPGPPGPPAPPALQILGMYNSGTNLLMQLMQKNLPEAHAAAYPPYAIWKHAYLEALSPSLRRELRQHVAVAMLRNPLAWLASLEKAPYNLANCAEGAAGDRAEAWLTEPCHMPEVLRNAGDPSPLKSSFLAASNVPVPFIQKRIPLANVETVWNRWAADYVHLSKFV